MSKISSSIKINSNLLASVTLFRELYNSETYKGVEHILSQFIIGAIKHTGNYSIDSYQIKKYLYETYGFEILESVIRNTTKKHLKDLYLKKDGLYHFEKELLEVDNKIIDIQETVDYHQSDFFETLYSFIEEKIDTTLVEKDKEDIIVNFLHFLLDNGYSDKYSNFISSFIILHSTNFEFHKRLNDMKEAAILYQGLIYSTDDIDEGHWKNELTIYLSTEHLFNAVGYNGELHKEIFNDFLELVKEINSKSNFKPNQYRNQLIEVKFLEETKNEVDHFFTSAESIKLGKMKLDRSKVAMVSILQGCHTKSDIIVKKSTFYSILRNLGIIEESKTFSDIRHTYNIVDNELIKELEEFSKSKKKRFSREYCIECLRIFSQINSFRKSKNSPPFEKIGHIYITDNGFANYLGRHNKVKFEDRDIPFSKDMDYIISKFWFKLKKGFTKSTSLPKTFDVLTKAKIIISHHINCSLPAKYEKLQDEVKDGKITKEEAVLIDSELKSKSYFPENINEDNINDSLDFLNDDHVIENIYRNQSKDKEIFHQTVAENIELSQKLKEFEKKEKEREYNEWYNKELERVSKESIMKWYSKVNTINKNIGYMFLILLINTIDVLIVLSFSGVLMNDNKNWINWLESIGNIKYIIIALLFLFFIFEFIFKQVFFNIEKFKIGINGLLDLILFRRTKKKEVFYSKELAKFEKSVS